MNDELDPIAQRLESERPVPRPAFRGELRRMLLGRIDRGHARPAGLRQLVAVYAGSGALLLLIAAVGLAGAGPLAAS